ncbi:hypothetical protein [Rhizobium leguminosarum]|uniref:hypothetical protein n=1 Tax=Rhizobium leguminosarum TaxID=384 RepID=UPI002E13A045|nr:hypothetical protein U8Q02_39540 [Rhizobium leguminosarum]
MLDINNAASVVLDVAVLHAGDEEEILRPMTFSPRDLSGIVGTAIELVNKFKNGDDVESTLVALQETLEMLDFETDALSRPDDANTLG